MTALPSIEQCREFLATINRGRVAIGLDPLEVLDFDGAVCDHPQNCLSARNLFCVGRKAFVSTGVVENADPRLCVVLDGGRQIPESILAVTRPFDSGVAIPALRARMVEAGVVAP